MRTLIVGDDLVPLGAMVATRGLAPARSYHAVIGDVRRWRDGDRLQDGRSLLLLQAVSSATGCVAGWCP